MTKGKNNSFRMLALILSKKEKHEPYDLKRSLEKGFKEIAAIEKGKKPSVSAREFLESL